MRHPFMQRSTPISPEEMREIYGVPSTQVRSCEDTLRKSSNRRKQQLMAVVEAIDLEKRRAERAWNRTKSRFAREHAELVRASKKVVYHKLGTISKQPEEAVPPCIPFLGTFPPSRHPTKARRVSEMFKEPLFSKSALPNIKLGVGSEAEEEEEEGGEEGDANRKDDDFAFYLATRRVSSSFGSETLDPSKFADIVERNFHLNRNKSAPMTSDSKTGRRASASFGSVCVDTARNNADDVDRNVRHPDKSASQISDGRTNRQRIGSFNSALVYPTQLSEIATAERDMRCSSSASQVTDAGFHQRERRRNSVAENNHRVNAAAATGHTTRRNVQRERAGSRLPDSGNISRVSTGSRKKAKSPGSRATDQTSKGKDSKLEHNNGRYNEKPSHKTTTPAGETDNRHGNDSNDDSEPMTGSSPHARAEAGSRNMESLGRSSMPTSGEGTPSKSNATPKSDQTSVSLDVELLQRALMEHSSHSLARSRWQAHRDSGRLHLVDHEAEDNNTLAVGCRTPGSSRSPSSVSTPTSRSATDISDIQNDTNLLVIRIILKLFRDLDDPQLCAIEEVWPVKMRTLRAEIEQLVGSTGVDITDILEKVQRGDVQDETSAALLDWVRNSDSCAPAEDDDTFHSSPASRRMSAHSAGPEYDEPRHARRKSNDSLGGAGIRSQARLTNAVRTWTGRTPVKEMPEIKVVPPSRRQSRVSEKDVGIRRRSKEIDLNHLAALAVRRSRSSGDPRRRMSVSSQTSGRRASYSSAGSAHLYQGSKPAVSPRTWLRQSPYSCSDVAPSCQTGKHAASQQRHSPYTSNDAAILYQLRKNSVSRSTSFDGSATEYQTEMATVSDLKGSGTNPSRSSAKRFSDASTDSEDKLPPCVETPQVSLVGHKHSTAAVLTAGKGNDSPSKNKLPTSPDNASPPCGSTPLSRDPGASDRDLEEGHGHQQQPQTVSSQHRLSANPGRRVSFLSHLNDRSDSDTDTRQREQRRSRASSYSRSESVESQCSLQSGAFRPRVFSTGQQYPTRNASGRLSRKEPRGRSLSPSHYRRVDSVESEDDPSEMNPSRSGISVTFDEGLAEDKERQETTRMVTHTDRQGRIRRLSMRKVSLANASSREANFIFTREDTLLSPEEESGQTNNDKAAKAKEESGQTNNDKAAKAKEAENQGLTVRDATSSDGALASQQGSREDARINSTLVNPRDHQDDETFAEDGKAEDGLKGGEEEGTQDGDQHYEDDGAKGTEDGDQHYEDDGAKGTEDGDQHYEDDGAKGTEEEEEDQRHEGNNDDIINDPDDDEILWRRRLTHPTGRMSWIEELSNDYKAQGLALSLLHRKQGAGQEFRSTVLSVICVNALMAAKSVYDDEVYRKVKQCRYLRMPFNYMVDVEGELSVKEIFS